MSDLISVQTTVIGDAEVRRHFQDFGDNLRERLRRTLADLGEELRAAARAAAPQKTGRLADSIRARLRETDTSMTETVRPGVFYAKFLEFGTVNHGTTSNRSRGGSKFAKVARVRELRSSGKYRIAPRPFMGPAMDSMRSRIEDSLRSVVAESVEKANI